MVADVGCGSGWKHLVLMVDVYHELQKPTGRLALVEYRGEDVRALIMPPREESKCDRLREMSDADTRVVTTDCVAWSTKANGKPEGGGDSRPVDVKKDTVVTVYGVSVETEPRSLLVRMTTDGGERSLEIRERFLKQPSC